MARFALVGVCALLAALSAEAQTVTDISADELVLRRSGGTPPVVLDVRTPEEFAEGHVPGAINVPHDQIEQRIAELEPYRDREVVLYCRSGRRAGFAGETLSRAGFANLLHLSGDMSAWHAEGRPEDAGSGPAETSVRPGLNETYLSPDLDVERYVGIFEGESREISTEREQITRALELKPGMSVADVGAGTGLFLEGFSRAVGADGRVYAVDISPRFLEHLEARARREGLTQVRVVRGDERSTSLEPASVDLAFVCDTYHHFEYPRAMLASLWQAIRPGGTLVVVDFERVPGKSRDWVVKHVRAARDEVQREIEAAGFSALDTPPVAGLTENYLLRFRRP
ncbi:MAG: methyltransferase domain-containing protein [Deltaproteobacteria bacterium]|nr:methyltransferase domain-containing protein [Deltaproteobacteria bacterium]